jgi:hypothetical protein
MLVEQYVKIALEEFPYLFNEYGFKQAYLYQGEGRDLGRYAFGIESNIYKMKMLFSRQRGGGSIYIGRTAPYNNEDSYLWFGTWNILKYLNQKPIDWSSLDRNTEEDQIRLVCRLISESFKPHCPHILEMFSSEEAIASWKPAYDKYIYKT